MASSKSQSHRASMFPTLSFPSLRSASAPPISETDTTSQATSNTSNTSSTSSRTLSKLRRQSIVDLLPSPGLSLGKSDLSSNQPSPVLSEAGNGEPVPPPRLLSSKARTWSHRLSSWVPSLTVHESDTTDPSLPQSKASLRRKPVGSNSISGPPPTTDSAPPPPPYKAVDNSGSANQEPASDTNEFTLPYNLPPEILYGDSASTSPQIRTHIPTSSFSTQQPQAAQPHIMAHPPSPEPKRATLTKQEPAAARGSQQNSPSTVDSSPKEDSPRHKLQKEADKKGARRNSLQNPKIGQAASSLQAAVTGLMPEQRGRRAVSAQVPAASAPPPEPGNNSRVSSYPISNPSRNGSSERGEQSPSRGRLRRSWLPGSGGGRSRSNSMDVTPGAQSKSFAWIMSDGPQTDYNPTFLQKGEKVPELWNESGNVYVYLYPRSSGCGPSFKVMEFTVSSSYVFNELIQSALENPSGGRSRARSFGGRNSLTADDASRIRSPPTSPPIPDSPGDMHLYLPAAPPSAEAGQLSTPGQDSDADLGRLIAIRNLFAFLTGQPLVATKTTPTVFGCFLQIAGLLEEFGFCAPDGPTFGTAVDLSFEFYIEQLGLADCRNSRAKTIEALILGERMRSLDLYSEAFAHAAGKYAAIMDLKLPLYEQVSVHTRQQLEKAHFDLVNRQHGVNQHIEQFDFPSLFAGIANSTSIAELKHVRFKIWKNSFTKMRNMTLNHYKTTFGNWPPKASSSKNPFAESGLNRLVLKMLYSDMCALYDLLVDRTQLTTRVIDEVPAISSQPGKMTVSALRNIMSEFDRSRPPVLPPVPFDQPQLPSVSSVLETYPNLSSKDQIKYDKNLKEHEMMIILNKAYNYDANRVKLPFLDKFKDFEFREAKGKMAPDLVDQRMGYWLFLYVTLQSLPMLVVDAPGLKYTEGVEYFLCQPPMGNPPWVEDRQVKKMWYEVAGGGGLVQLSTDAVLFSVEATYHRSHCWLAAKKWQGGPDETEEDNFEDPLMSSLPPPPVLQGDDSGGLIGSPPPMGAGTSPTPPLSTGSPSTLRPRNLSPAGGGSRASRASHAYRSSIAIGLEPVPMEAPQPNFGGSHIRSSSHGPRPLSTALGGNRNRSVGNLSSLGQQQSGHGDFGRDSPNQGLTSSATFDDILGGEKAAKKSGKKKGFFF